MLDIWTITDRSRPYIYVLVNQKNGDQIIRLAIMVSDVFPSVHDAEPLKVIKAHIKFSTLLIQYIGEGMCVLRHRIH